jgi:predicted metal-dependent hydrolase
VEQGVIIIKSMNIEIIKSNRKTLAIEIKKDLRIIVRAPMFVSNTEIQMIVKEKSAWIKKHIEKIKLQNEQEKQNPIPKFTEQEIHNFVDKAMKIIPKRVEYYAKIMDVSYGRITIRNQKTRWGSCSAKGHLNFNCLLIMCPTEVLDYVVVHELCHLKEMNHSKNFWRLVKRFCPEYEQYKKWLKTYGNELIGRIK